MAGDVGEPHRRSSAPLELDDLDADLSLHPEEHLPTPNPEAFFDWWARESPRLSTASRLLHGQPWSVAALLDRLRHGPLRRRHAWALELAIRSSGAFDFDTRTWADRQLQQLQSFNHAAPVIVAGFRPNS